MAPGRRRYRAVDAVARPGVLLSSSQRSTASPNDHLSLTESENVHMSTATRVETFEGPVPDVPGPARPEAAADPLVLGLPLIAVGAFALGLQLVGFVNVSSDGSPLAVLIGASGLGPDRHARAVLDSRESHAGDRRGCRLRVPRHRIASERCPRIPDRTADRQMTRPACPSPGSGGRPISAYAWTRSRLCRSRRGVGRRGSGRARSSGSDW